MYTKTMMRLSMTRQVISFVLFILCAPMLSCSKVPVDTNQPEGNVIKGTIYDAHGNKFQVSGAKVTVYIYGNGNIGQTDPVYQVDMDGNSHYEIKVPNNTYAVHARALVKLNDQTVAIDLKPLDGKPDNIALASAPGIVRNFALQLTGEIPGGDASTIQGYYGAKVWFGDGQYNFTGNGYWTNLNASYPGAKVQFVLSPATPLIDGSKGENITEEATVQELLNGKWFVNIPYAVYQVKATLVTADGRNYSLMISKLPAYTSTGQTQLLTFPPDNSDPFQRPGKEQVAVWDRAR